tara:strand:+ start:3768 stop:5012 length:1245 start_codon:yes stop_codon:yes gene_type:complete
MPRRKTKRNLKKRGGVGSKRRRSPSFRKSQHKSKQSRTSLQTSAVTAYGRDDQAAADAAAAPLSPVPLSPVPPSLTSPPSHLALSGPSPRDQLMSLTPFDRRPLSDQLTQPNRRTQNPLTQSRYNAALLMPTAGTEDYGPTNQRLENLIKKIEETQIRMDKRQIPTADWEEYKSANHPLTIVSAVTFLVNQEKIITEYYNKHQQRQQDGIRQNNKIMKHMLKKTGKRSGLMTLAYLATLMANDLYTDKPTGIPPYQHLIADTPTDIVNEATGNYGLIQGVEEIDTRNPNYYTIYSEGKIIYFDPSTTTMEQWHEAKQKAILDQKPFSIYDDQDAVNFFLEKGNKDLLGIALKKISHDQKILLERARLAQVIKEKEKQRRNKIRGDNTKNKRNNKGNNNNKHNNQFTRRGTGRGK